LFQIDLKNRKAIYAQVVDNFKRLIMSGVLKPDEKAPSVREMAAALTVNPNTVQKAYRELESQGYFYTVLGQGNFIAAPKQAELEAEIAELYESLYNIVQELKFRGEDIQAIIDSIGQSFIPLEGGEVQK